MRTKIILPSCLLLGLVGCIGEQDVECIDSPDGVVCSSIDEPVAIYGKGGKGKGNKDKCSEIEEEDVGALIVAANDPDLQWGPCPPFFPEGCEIAVIQGDPSQDNSDIFFKVPANSEIPNHTHTSAERMALVSGEMELHYAGQETALLALGEYAYGPAEAPHSASCGDAGPCILMIAFEKPVDAFEIEGAGVPVEEEAITVNINDPDLLWGPCPALFPAGCELAIIHGDPSQSNTDLLFRIPPGYDIPSHAHTSAERMVLLSGTLDIHYSPQEKDEIKTLEYAYGPAGAPHTGHCQDDDNESCVLLIAFESAVDAFGVEPECIGKY